MREKFFWIGLFLSMALGVAAACFDMWMRSENPSEYSTGWLMKIIQNSI